jgi:hypothetical protein
VKWNRARDYWRHYWPIVPALDDNGWRRVWNSRRNAWQRETCSIAALSTSNPICPDPSSIPVQVSWDFWCMEFTETETSSFYWFHLNIFHLKSKRSSVSETSCFWIKARMMDNVQNCDSYIFPAPTPTTTLFPLPIFIPPTTPYSHGL